jgi:uncharacterized protein (TIGR02646 family)
MIRINRGQPPDGFDLRAKALHKRFKAAQKKDPQISAAKFWASVRRDLGADASELARRFHFKCGYCESRMRHVSYPHIEHYKPKGRKRFEHLMFDWTNWLLSCGVCNDEKWTEFPEHNGKPALLDPTVDEPRHHIGFRRNFTFALSDRGDVTIRLVCLYRHDLERERGSWLLKIDAFLLLSLQSQDEEVRHGSRDYLIWAMQDDAPYAAMTRQHLSEVCPQLANPAVPHPLVDGEKIQQTIANVLLKHHVAAC